MEENKVVMGYPPVLTTNPAKLKYFETVLLPKNSYFARSIKTMHNTEYNN